MEVEIYEETRTKKKVNIDFPYFYEQDMLLDRDDCIMYGVYVSPYLSHQITITIRGDGHEEYAIEKGSGINSNCYLTEEHKSTKEEFLRALKKLDKFTDQLKTVLNIKSDQKELLELTKLNNNLRDKSLKRKLNEISDVLIPKQVFTSSEHQKNMILHAIGELRKGKKKKTTFNVLKDTIEIDVLKDMSYQEINDAMNQLNDKINLLNKELIKVSE